MIPLLILTCIVLGYTIGSLLAHCDRCSDLQEQLDDARAELDAARHLPTRIVPQERR